MNQRKQVVLLGNWEQKRRSQLAQLCCGWGLLLTAVMIGGFGAVSSFSTGEVPRMLCMLPVLLGMGGLSILLFGHVPRFLGGRKSFIASGEPPTDSAGPSAGAVFRIAEC